MKLWLIIFIGLISSINIFANLQDDLEQNLDQVTCGVGGILSGSRHSTAWTPGIGNFLAGLGVNILMFELEDPRLDDERLKFAYPVYYGEAQIGLFNGKEIPRMGMVMGKIAFLGRYGFMPVPAPLGSDDGMENIPFWSAGIKIGTLEGGLLYPNTSMTVMYTSSQEIEIFDQPLSSVDSSYSAYIRPEIISVSACISKRLFYLTPYLDFGVNSTNLRANYCINPPTTRAGSSNGSQNSQDYNHREFSFNWRLGAELSLFPFISGDIEGGMTGGKWSGGIGVRAQW
ncbi:MAG: hypothetical protein ACP5FK_05000 [bacterium]